MTTCFHAKRFLLPFLESARDLLGVIGRFHQMNQEDPGKQKRAKANILWKINMEPKNHWVVEENRK